MTLRLKNLGKRINRNWIVRAIDLEVGNGECLAILGPSGCGKSSTLRLTAGLDKPDEGQVYINGINVNDISPVDRKIGMVFQSYALFPHLTVSSNLVLGLKIRGASKQIQKDRVSSILSTLQLEHLANRLPSELSGGQRQRVALARALLRDPLVYLLDEPMSNLDAQLREELRTELRRLILKREQPVVYVTHDQHEAMAMADKIAVLNKGTLEQIGTPEELYKKPSSIFVASFIGRPKINIISDKSTILKTIRPENIRFTASGLKCKLIDKEWLGINQLLILESDLGTLRMICSSNEQIPKDLFISWEKSDESHFDANTGLRLPK